MSENRDNTPTSLTFTPFAPDSDRGADSSLPEHLFPLDTRWALWRFVCLRGAGFPGSQALELAAPECAAAADQLLQAQEAVERARENALTELDHKHLQAGTERQALLAKMMRVVRRIQPPQALEVPDTGCEAVEDFRAAYLHLAKLRADFPGIFRAATLNVSRAIHTMARTDRFREAVLWQNRQAIHTGMDSLLRHTPEQTSQNAQQRKHEALVANYIQRYAMKNDSIGFFGPIGCASIVSSGEAISVRPGSHLLAARCVYFEGWCIEALAAMLARDKRILPWCAPRPMPHISVDGNMLILPFAPPIKLTRKQAIVLMACDGVRTAREIAQMLIAQPAGELWREEEVYAILEQLCASQRIVWTLEIAPEGALPENALRSLLQRIEDEPLRLASIAALERLEQARATVADAAGNAERLDEALENMNAIFMELTGQAPTRADGKMYAGRTLLYEDCRRDIEVALGPEFIGAMQKPLTLLLASARWFTYQVAELYQQAFIDAYIELAEESNSLTVNFADFWLWMQPLLYDDEERLSDLVTPEFQRRWAEVFALTDEQRQLHQLHYSSEALRSRVLERFDAPGPGWNAACYHSPDILIQAKSPEAICNGDYQVVLGEFHIAMNTLQIVAFLAQHPTPDRIIQAASLDIPAPRVLPILSKDIFPMYRVRPALATPKDIYLVYTPDVTANPQAQALMTGSLVVEESEGRLVARTRDYRWRFDLIEVFAEFLSRLVFSSFKLLPASKHAPRISIDRLIVARESWGFTPAELLFACEKAAADRFIAARCWANRHQMPRFVFVKVPTEQKPCFIDFDSPISIDMLAKMVRQNMEQHPDDLCVTITEMLPTPDQLWLRDADDRHYSSELRFVAVDLAPRPQ